MPPDPVANPPAAKPLTARIEVFRPGTFTPMQGAPITYTAADLKAVADAYDATTAPAPVVIGHPVADAPAFGWVEGFAYDSQAERLFATLHQIEPAFADLVKAGRFKKVSMSFFAPGQPHNPVPGTWYPKHVGFLGAAAPAVSGLKNASFAGEAGATFTASFGTGAQSASLFRRIRDWMIDRDGLEAADKVLPPWEIDWLDEADEPAARMYAETQAGSRYAEPPAAKMDTMMPFMAPMEKMMASMAALKSTGSADADFLMMMIPHHRSAIAMAKVELETGSDPAPKEKAQQIIDAQEAEIAELTTLLNEAGPRYAEPPAAKPEDPPVPDKTPHIPKDKPDPALAAREAAIATREAAIAAREAALASADHAAFAERLVTEGRLLPALRDKVVAILDAVPGDAAVSFAEGVAPVSIGAALREVLEAQPKVVSFGAAVLPEGGSGEQAAAFAADGRAVDPERLALHNKALDYQRAHPGTAYDAAVRAVS